MPTGILYKITVSPSVCRLQKADVTKKMNPAFFLFLFIQSVRLPLFVYLFK